MPLLLAVIWLFLEIRVYALVAAAVGGGHALLLTLAAAMAGFALIKRQRLADLIAGRMPGQYNAGPDRADSVPDRIGLALAGMLLVLPGFLSDGAALLLLVPNIRRWAAAQAKSRAGAGAGAFASPIFRATNPDQTYNRPRPPGDVIEGDYERVDDDDADKDADKKG